MTRLAERLRSEQQFHDRQAELRALALKAHEYQFSDADYLGHASWIAPAFAQLGDVRGRRVLDLGCGHGMAAVVLARRGARVTACDLSAGYVRETQTRAAANAVHVACTQANAEELPFVDGSFDRVWGNAILHHLDLAKTGVELRRVLRPGGVAVFCEPWGENPLLRWARRGLPYPGKARTPDEEPLREFHLKALRQSFPALQITGCQLFSMISRVIRWQPVLRALERCDAHALSWFPTLQRSCRYVIVVLKNEC
jgi:ubiquinone/menaquinone biosynthesis C-methylase UbiE